MWFKRNLLNIDPCSWISWRILSLSIQFFRELYFIQIWWFFIRVTRKFSIPFCLLIFANFFQKTSWVCEIQKKFRGGFLKIKDYRKMVERNHILKVVKDNVLTHIPPDLSQKWNQYNSILLILTPKKIERIEMEFSIFTGPFSSCNLSPQKSLRN